MSTIKNNLKKIGLFTVSSVASIAAFAQEKTADINLNVTETSNKWYTQPWMWVVGGAVFILLLVALLRGGKKSD